MSVKSKIGKIQGFFLLVVLNFTKKKKKKYKKHLNNIFLENKLDTK